MASPMPAGADAAAALLAPAGDGLLASSSPLSFSFPSPGVGRTPGAHAIQEGRLSLEMFGLAVDAGLATAPLPAMAPVNSDALAHTTAAGALKGSAIPLPNPPTANQQPKLTPPALATATTEQLNAKDAYAEQLKQALPAKLAAEAAQAIDRSTASLSLPSLNVSRVAAAVSGVLTENGAGGAVALPRLPTREPQQLEQRAADGAAAAAGARTSRRAAAKRGRDTDDDVDPATLPEKKRHERMEAGYAVLRAEKDKERALTMALLQAQAELARRREYNDQLWSLVAHIGSCIHAAAEERDAVAFQSLGPEPPATDLAGAAGGPFGEMLPPEARPPPGLVPVAPPPSAGPLFTPGGGLGFSLFSPINDDLIAACGMFVSPMDGTAVAAGAPVPLRGPLFPDTAAPPPAVEAKPAVSEDKSFSFKL